MCCVLSDSSCVSSFIQLKKVFSVQGPYPVIRAALWARGWVERRLLHPVHRGTHCHGDEEEDVEEGDISTGEAVTLRRTKSDQIHQIRHSY